MDIDLLSKMIKEIILDRDEVTLPGVGTFVAEVVPSSFSDKGYTINPPYRRLSFRQREAADTSLVDFYAKSNALDRDAATSILVRFLAELRETLISRKTIVFPELGRLRATRENHFFFVPDENLNIYPEGFGLEPVSLKTHVETEDDFAIAMNSLQSILGEQDASAEELVNLEIETVIEPAATPIVKDEEPQQTAEAVPMVEPEKSPASQTGTSPASEVRSETGAAPAPEREAPESARQVREEAGPEPGSAPEPAARPASGTGRERRRMPLALKLLLWLIAACALLLGIFILLSHIAPDFIDTLLYNEEELQLIHR